MLQEWLTKQNETLDVWSCRLTCSIEVKVKNGNLESELQVMIKGIKLKALEVLEYPWRPFCGLKRVHCVRFYANKLPHCKSASRKEKSQDYAPAGSVLLQVDWMTDPVSL